MNNIDIHVNKTSSYCHIDLYDKASDKNISFYVNNTNLLSKDIKDTVFLQEDLLKAYELEDRAVIEATTYTNHLSLLVDAQDFTLVSEDVNRVAVFNGETPVTQVTAVKVIDEEGNELRSSMHIQEDSDIEIVIEEEVNKAMITLEFTPYVEFNREEVQHIVRIDGEDYWASNGIIYKSNAITEQVEEYCMTNCSSSDYASMPQMLSKEIYYRSRNGFYKKTNGS